MTTNYIVHGRLVPELLGVSYTPNGEDDFDGIKTHIKIAESKIVVICEVCDEKNISDLWNVIYSRTGNVINNISFLNQTALTYDIDSIVDLNAGQVAVKMPYEPIFEGLEGFEDQITFVRHAERNRVHSANHPSVSRATFELRNSIRYPDFTAMHCRHAIEAIRNAFGDGDFPTEKNQQKGWETGAWEKMRDALNLCENSLKSFNDIANEQRHGRNRWQTWEQRRVCMQIAWETLHRFLEYLSNGKTKLSDSDYPKLTMAYSPETNDSIGTQ